MTITEIKEDILNLRAELQNLISNGEQEQRELNEGETSRMAEIAIDIQEKEKQLKELEDENRKLN